MTSEVITSTKTGGGLNIDSKLHPSREKIRYVFSFTSEEIHENSLGRNL